MFDIAIINGLVLDGTSRTPSLCDIGIKDGLIVELANDLSAEANKVIDATHKMVAPGFIDVHSHCDLVPFMTGSIRESRIRQGVTTELIGQCGLGSAPYTETMQDWRNYLTPILGTLPQTWAWPNFLSFICDLDKAKMPNNIASLIGHGLLEPKY